MAENVGYKLIDEKGNVVAEWGGVWGVTVAPPNPVRLPNGVEVWSMGIDSEVQGYKLVRWAMEKPAPTKQQVKEERDRRVDSGFVFSDKRYQSRQEDRENIAGAGTLAAIAIMNGAKPGDLRWHGGEEDFAWIAEDNSINPMDAFTVIQLGKTAAAWKSAHIFAARALKDLPEIPADFDNDKFWPSVK